MRFQFNLTASWELPIGKGRLLNLSGVRNSLLGGWTLNAISYLSDGVPIASPVETGNPYFNQRVDLVCDPSANAAHTATQWFSPQCLAQPASQFVPGTAPAYLANVRTDGAHDLDASLYKNFALGGDRDLRLDVSSFNVTNSVQYGSQCVLERSCCEGPDGVDGLWAGIQRSKPATAVPVWGAVPLLGV